MILYYEIIFHNNIYLYKNILNNNSLFIIYHLLSSFLE